jgi:hypothetical protein
LLGLADTEEKYVSTAEKSRAQFEKSWFALSNSWNAVEGAVARAIEAIKIQVGSVIAVAIRPFMDWLTALLNKIQDFVKYNQEFVAAISQIAAVIAAIASAAGVLLVIAGSLVGLSAAIGLIDKGFEKWMGTIKAVLGVFGLLILAVAENFEYIRDSAITVLENLSVAFGDTSGSIEGLGEMIEDITRPIRELMGLLVRMAAEIAEVASAALAFVGMQGVLQAVTTLFTVLFGAKILMGAFKLVAALTGINTVMRGMNISRMATLSTSLSLLFQTRTISEFRNGIKLVGSSIMGMMGGGLGLVALVATLGILAYEAFPAVKDIVDSIL